MEVNIFTWGEGAENSGISIKLIRDTPVATKTIKIRFRDGEPEDFIMCRDLNDAYKIEDAAKVENTEKEPMYIFVITQNLTTYDMVLAENGHILQKEKRTEEGDGKIKFKRITKKKDSK